MKILDDPRYRDDRVKDECIYRVLSIKLRLDLLFANAEATSALSSATVLVWSKKIASQSAKQYDEVVASQVR